MVHWDRKLYRSRLLKQVLLLLGLGVGFSVFYSEHSSFAGKESPFTIEERLELPIKEISGGDLITGSGGQAVNLISDRKAEVVRLNLKDGHIEKVDFKNLMVERFSLCRSEDFEECRKLIKKLVSNWEALSSDASGRLFLLQEHTQSVLVFDSSVRSIERALHFNFGDAFPDMIGRGSKKFQTNSLGEGLILLKNGHILIAKEQYPVALVEFGPAGSEALGFSPETVLGPADSFQLPASDSFHLEYKPLASWILSGHSKCDVSDLDSDAQGRLVILSQTCNGVAVIEKLDPLEKALVVDYKRLPDEILNPEALIIAGDRWLVASDIPKKRQHNFYILRPRDSL